MIYCHINHDAESEGADGWKSAAQSLETCAQKAINDMVYIFCPADKL